VHLTTTKAASAEGRPGIKEATMEVSDAASLHRPVMVEQVVELLSPALRRPGAVLLDGTVGMGGHAHALLTACPTAVLVGIDRDREALRLAGQRLAPFGGRIRLVQAVYDQLGQVCSDLGVVGVQAILLDLGVSSLQLDADHRGFAYRVDAPLDMRMDQSTGSTAADVLNTYPADELVRVLRGYGEERYARRIVAAVVRERVDRPFTTSARLVEVVRAAVPAAPRQGGGHPAKRTFQALRIEVNGELEALGRALPAAVRELAVGGRIAVLAYHSLEDRMVKQLLGAGARSSAPPDLPVELPQHAPYLRLLTRGARVPDPEETEINSRATSARFRVAERVRADSGRSG
jgi:16S rRNA (cytosine1402-N4)-methyltransferase